MWPTTALAKIGVLGGDGGRGGAGGGCGGVGLRGSEGPSMPTTGPGSSGMRNEEYPNLIGDPIKRASLFTSGPGRGFGPVGLAGGGGASAFITTRRCSPSLGCGNGSTTGTRKVSFQLSA